VVLLQNCAVCLKKMRKKQLDFFSRKMKSTCLH